MSFDISEACRSKGELICLALRLQGKNLAGFNFKLQIRAEFVEYILPVFTPS